MEKKTWSSSSVGCDFVIMCEVSGGVTGFRKSMMKDGEGKLMFFRNREDAQAICDKYNREFNGQYRTANFKYYVEEY
jgi:hypothetical protein